MATMKGICSSSFSSGKFSSKGHCPRVIKFTTGDPPALYYIWLVKVGEKTLGMTSNWLWEMFAEICTENFPLVKMGAEWSVVCAPADIFNIELEFILLKLCTGGTSVSDISIYSGVYYNNDRIVA